LLKTLHNHTQKSPAPNSAYHIGGNVLCLIPPIWYPQNGRLPFTETVTCTTVGELCMAIELVMLENDLFRSQITVHEQ
jgi:hypothetical protein